MYELPIEVISIDYADDMEEAICRRLMRFGIKVNKEELIKAIKYDRDQYFKGYKDCLKERVKILEKQLDIAIKDLCFTAKGADACNSLDDLYEGIREKIEEQARKEVQE